MDDYDQSTIWPIANLYLFIYLYQFGQIKNICSTNKLAISSNYKNQGNADFIEIEISLLSNSISYSNTILIFIFD